MKMFVIWVFVVTSIFSAGGNSAQQEAPDNRVVASSQSPAEVELGSEAETSLSSAVASGQISTPTPSAPALNTPAPSTPAPSTPAPSAPAPSTPAASAPPPANASSATNTITGRDSYTFDRNEIATISIVGLPNTRYAITVMYNSGASKAEGLEDKTSDASGRVSWSWKIGGRTAFGTYTATITGGGATKAVQFTVADVVS